MTRRALRVSIETEMRALAGLLLLLSVLAAGSVPRTAAAAPCPHEHPSTSAREAAAPAPDPVEVGLATFAVPPSAAGIVAGCAPGCCVAHCPILLPASVESGPPSPRALRLRPPRGDVPATTAADGPWRPPPRSLAP